MDERCLRPLFCTIKAELGRGQPGLMRWSWDETLPQCSIDRSTLQTAAHRATSELVAAPTTPGEQKVSMLSELTKQTPQDHRIKVSNQHTQRSKSYLVHVAGHQCPNKTFPIPKYTVKIAIKVTKSRMNVTVTTYLTFSELKVITAKLSWMCTVRHNRMSHVRLGCQISYSHINSYSASHDNWCTVGGDGGCRVGEVRAGTTSPMPDHKGFKLQ